MMDIIINNLSKKIIKKPVKKSIKDRIKTGKDKEKKRSEKIPIITKQDVITYKEFICNMMQIELVNFNEDELMPYFNKKNILYSEEYTSLLLKEKENNLFKHPVTFIT